MTRDWNEYAFVQALNSASGFCAGVAAAFGYSDRIGEGIPYPDGWEAAFDDLVDATEAARLAELWWSFSVDCGPGGEVRALAAAARGRVDALQAAFVELMRVPADVA